MNGVDYTKQLNKEKQYMRESLQKNRKATDKEIANQEARHETIQDKMSKNYIEDKADLESNYSKNVENMREKTKDSVENLNKKYNTEIAKKRDQFEHDSQIKKKDFDQRLNDIKSSYEKSFESERDTNQNISESKQKAYQRNLKDYSSKTDAKIAEYHDKVAGTGASLKDEYLREQQQQTRAHEEQLKKVVKKENDKQLEIKHRLSDNLNKTKESHEAEVTHLRGHSKDRLTSQRNQFQSQMDNLARDYSDRNDKMTETSREQQLRNNRETQKRFTDLDRNYNKELRQIEVEKRRRENGSDEFAATAMSQQGFSDKDVTEKKMKGMREDVVKAKNSYSNRINEDQDKFSEELRTQNREAAARVERKENEMKAEKIVSMAKERQGAQKKVEQFEFQNKVQKNNHENMLNMEQKVSRDKIQKLKENFNESMKTIEEKYKENLNIVNASNKQDKTEYIKKFNDERMEQIESMKREFARSMDATVNEYEQKLAQFQKENELLKMSMESKIASVIDQTDNKLNTMAKLYEERRTADMRDHQLLTEQKENNLKSTINQINLTSQKKMDQMGLMNDRKLKLLTDDYENKLRELQASKATELNAKDIGHQVELDKLKTSFADEKMRTVSQYENRIATIRNAHEEQMEQMKSFKRLT